MKIKKIITESVKLKEADETTAEVIDSNDSAAEILDKVEDAAEGTDVVNTTEVAAEIAAASDKIEAEKTVVDLEDDTSLGVKNKITDALDMALKAALRFKKKRIPEVANIMICGLPGSGKTASVYDWSTQATADGKPVNITYLNMKNNDLDAFINGYTVQDKDDPDYVKQAFSRNLNGLEQENSILFLDEYNRQTENQIRASVLTLINEHYVVGKDTGGRHYFKNFLFTVAVMNPSARTDRGAAELNDAEKSRFLFYYTKMDSDPETTEAYLNKQYDKSIQHELARENPDYDEIETDLRIKDLGTFIVKDPAFKYDGEDKLATLARTNRKMLNQRSLTAGLAATMGDKDLFKNWLMNGANFLTNEDEGILPGDSDASTTEMLLAILADYAVPTREELFKAAGINAGIETTDAEQTDATSDADAVIDSTANNEADAEDAGDIEDDDDPDFWTASSNASGQIAASPSEADKIIKDTMAGWNL